MPFVDDLNRILRDHEGYTGDGHGGNGALPVGDRSTARKPISKRDLREILLQMAQTMGDPSALEDILDQLDTKADLVNSGKIYANRADAVSAGQAVLVGALGRITTIEDDYVVYRAPFQNGDDPLFATPPYWGVVARVPKDQLVEAAIDQAGLVPLVNVAGTGDAITADFPAGVGAQTFTAGRVFRVTTVSDSTSNDVTITVAGTTRRFRDSDMALLPAGFIKSGRTYLFETYGAQFARLISKPLTQNELDALVNAAGLIGLVNIAGTPDALTADFPANAGSPAFVAGKLFRFSPVSDATIASATVTVAGVTRTIRDVDLSEFSEPFLKAGRTYVFESYGSGLLRLVAAPVTQAELDAWDAGTDAKLEIIREAPAYADGSRALMRFGGRDIMRMYPDGPRLSGSAAEVWQPAGTRGIAAMDQFAVVGGYRYPSAMIDGVSRKAIIISVYGQSNADVTEMDDSLIWAAPPMPNHILMLNDVSGARGGLRGWLGVAAPAGSSLIPAREDAVVVNGDYVQSYATAAAARLNDLIGAPYRVFAVRASGVGGQKLVGDAAGQGIWKDSDGAYVRSWLNWSQDVRNMRDSLIALGYEIEAVHICFTHQEADWQTARATYASQLTDMVAEREAILATDLPGIPVRWFVDQASGSGYRTGGYLGGAWPARMAIQDVAQAHTNMTMVMPRYTMRFGFNGGALEDIHHAFYDRINPQGETYAHAMREVMEGRDWRCPWPTAAAISGNDVVIDFDSIEPLVLDPGFCKVRPDMGFELWNGSAAVGATDVRLTGQRQVTVTFPSAPVAGQSIRYAYHLLDGSDVSDEWPLSTGALRDAWESDSLFLPGKKLVRPALGFELQL